MILKTDVFLCSYIFQIRWANFFIGTCVYIMFFLR